MPLVTPNKVQITIEAVNKASPEIKKVSQDLDRLGNEAEKISRPSKGLGSMIGSLTDVASAIGLAEKAFGAVSTAMSYSINQAAEAERVQAQLNAVLRSTQEAAGLSAQELEKMALELSRVTTYDDEAVKSTEALLLTFTSIGKDVFPDALAVILDMSTALGQDLKSSAIQVGKALQDPVNGMLALRRVGVNFNDDQKEIVKNLVETGRTLEAQRYILNELSTEFGGSAAAAANTYQGQIQQLKNELGNLGEAVGNELLPEIKTLTGLTKDFTVAAVDSADQVKVWLVAIGQMAPAVNPLITAFSNFIKLLGFIPDSTEEATGSIPPFVAGLEEVPPAMDAAEQAAKEYEQALKETIKTQNQFYNSQFSQLDKLAGMREKDAQSEEQFTDRKTKLQNELVSQQIYLSQLYMQADKAAKQHRVGPSAEEINNARLRIIEIEGELAELSVSYEKAQEAEEKAYNQMIFDALRAKLAIDGVTTEAEYLYELQVGKQLGLYTEADVKTLQDIQQAAGEFAAAAPQELTTVEQEFLNLNKPMSDVADTMDRIAKHDGETVRFHVLFDTFFSGMPMIGTPNSGTNLHPSAGGGNFLGGYAEGGTFTVPGSGSGDQPYMLGLTPGETVSISPPGESGQSVVININADVRSLNDLDYFAQEVARRIR